MEPIYAGCDLGIATAKVALVSNDRVLAWDILPYTNLPREAAAELFERVLAANDLTPEHVAGCLATGLGKSVVPNADAAVPGRVCLHRAVRKLDVRIGTVLDIGAHSFTAFSLNHAGDIAESTIDDKCATGTGLYIELMAKALDTPLEELIRGALPSQSPAPMTNQCAILAESDVISLLSEGHGKYDVFAGVGRAVATKIVGLVSQVGLVGKVALTGGVAKNELVVKDVERLLGVSLADPGVDSQVFGALGAALLARDQAVGEAAPDGRALLSAKTLARREQ